MINEFELYHGAALVKLVHATSLELMISRYSKEGNASYVINNEVGLFLKHSTKRMTPWRFTFTRMHQEEIKSLKEKYGQVFVGFICGTDGIPILRYDELKEILDEDYEEYEWISFARNRGQEYKVQGSNGKLSKKIPRNEFPKKLIDTLNLI